MEFGQFGAHDWYLGDKKKGLIHVLLFAGSFPRGSSEIAPRSDFAGGEKSARGRGGNKRGD